MSETGTTQPSETDESLSGLAFEQALKELETIVSRLEQGDVDLEQSIKFYERGEALKRHCEKLLSAAEMKIEKIRLSARGDAEGKDAVDIE
ncbi:MAG: exodeoxyribonuclease VII small subunit [Pseudomonadota bacterium]